MRRHGTPGLTPVVVMTILLSIAPWPSLAQGAPPDRCPAGHVFDGASAVSCTISFLGEPSGQEPVDPGQAPADEASPAADGGEDPAAAQAPSLTLLARLCPPEVAGMDLEGDFTGDCAESASGFTLEILVDGESTGTYTTDAGGEIAVPAELGPGQYLFRYQPIPGLLELRIVCQSVYPDGATATGRSRMGPDVDELYLTYDGRGRTTCTFFFIVDAATPEAGGDEGDASVNVPAFTLQLTLDGLATGQTVIGGGTWAPAGLAIPVDPGITPTSQAPRLA